MTQKIITNLPDAIAEIKQADITNGLQLCLADEVWQDVPGASITGKNIAIIVFTAVSRGLIPDGDEQHAGYKLYRFRADSDSPACVTAIEPSLDL